MDDWVTVLLAFGAVLRGTRLVALDDITQPIRDRLGGWVLKLVTCGWCASLWIAGLVVAPTWWAWGDNRIWQAAALAATASWLAGALHFAGLPSRHEVEVTPVGALPVAVLPSMPPKRECDDCDDDADQAQAGGT